VVDEPITDSELKLARQGATSAWKSGRGIVDKDDLVAEANLWMVEHLEKVRQWRDEGRHGQNKLRNACRQRCLTIVARERRRQSQLTRGDLAYYTPQMLREILPTIFHVEDWVSGAIHTGETRAPSRPAEGNTRLAMVIDVRSAFDILPPKDKALLSDLYADGGLAIQVVAAQLEVTERTVRRREERALDKMVERLGGEPPWYR
jgi:RNA polymerase sigma factor (sigma-70 family)